MPPEVVNGMVVGKSYFRRFDPDPADQGHSVVKIRTRVDRLNWITRRRYYCECGRHFGGVDYRGLYSLDLHHKKEIQ